MQGLRIKTPEDIQKLPGYISKIDPERNPLSHIIKSYYISPFEIPCGLCGQPHMDGKLVAIVSDSTDIKPIANIGHICGKKRFGDKYLDANRRYYETTEKPQLIQRLTEGRSKIDTLQMKMHGLRHQAEDIKRRRLKFISLFPDTYKDLVRRAHSANTDVYTSVERTKEEIDDLLAANRYQDREKLLFKDEYKGSIGGHKFPRIDWTLEHGVMRVFIDAEKLSEQTIRSMPVRDMIKWANWLDDFDENLERVESAILEGEQFFTTANFRLFVDVPAPQSARERFRSLTVAELDAHRLAALSEAAPVAANKEPPRRRARSELRRPDITSKQLRKILGNKKVW